ncbi:MAG: MltA domain-containing protein [Elusimicrobia bacterium]|nr:MltA domain-containing protein [Elusimicrobiota bacterium]
MMLLALLLAAASASAQPPVGAGGPAMPPPAVSTAPASGPALTLVAEDALPRFEESFKAKAGLIKAAKKAVKYLESLPPNKALRLAGRDYAPAALIDSAKEIAAIAATAKSADEFDARVRAGFDVFQSAGLDGQGRVVFSSYYQPTLKASLKKAPGYARPLYRRPPDMVEVDLAAFGKNGGGDSLVLGRVGKDKRVTPYWTREEIDRRKTLAGKGLEVAWLKDPLDVMDLHVQGSGILKLASGKEVLVKYAGTNGRPFNSVGLTLVRTGAFARDEITFPKMHDYLRANPDAESWILSTNPRYTFFEVAPLPEDGEPYGAAECSLVPARSIAIDPAVFPLGALAFFTTTSPQADKTGRVLGQFPTARFAFALDTGGAIKSPGRVDIYAGHGAQAEATARGQWADGKLWFLVKKLPPRER